MMMTNSILIMIKHCNRNTQRKLFISLYFNLGSTDYWK